MMTASMVHATNLTPGVPTLRGGSVPRISSDEVKRRLQQSLYEAYMAYANPELYNKKRKVGAPVQLLNPVEPCGLPSIGVHHTSS